MRRLGKWRTPLMALALVGIVLGLGAPELMGQETEAAVEAAVEAVAEEAAVEEVVAEEAAA